MYQFKCIMCISISLFYIVFTGILNNVNVCLVIVNFSLLCICFDRKKLKTYKNTKSYFAHNSLMILNQSYWLLLLFEIPLKESPTS